VWAVLGPVVGWSFVGTGLYAWRRRPESRFGLLMTLLGFAWFLGPLPASDVALVFTLGISLGALWGLVAAYFGGAPDLASQRVVDSLMALPPIVLALGLMAALGQSVNNVILALTILLMPTAARTVRAVALGVQVSPYIEAAQAVGCSHGRIIVRHILPNCLATYIVLVTTNVSYSIVVEAALSFLGAGAPPDEPSWGGMLTAGTQVMERAPWMMLFPGLAISLAVLALNLLGDAIRDVADPRLRGGLG
jgi:peptide/nickel transport system permease protein